MDKIESRELFLHHIFCNFYCSNLVSIRIEMRYQGCQNAYENN